MAQGTVRDFQSRQRFAPQHVRRLRAVHELLADTFGQSLSDLLRTSAAVGLASVEQLPYGQFIGDIETPACFYVLNAEPLDDRAMLDFQPSILLPMIDRLLGGAGEEAPTPGQPLTEIEQCLAARIVRLFLQEYRSAWKDVLDLKLDVLQMESNPRLLRLLPADEMVMLIRFELAVGQRRGAMRFCVPCRAIERISERLSAATAAPIARPLPGSLAQVGVALAETPIAADQLADLRVGDIIATETAVDSPATVSIDGVAGFHAKPGVYCGRRAVRLTGPIDSPSPSD